MELPRQFRQTLVVFQDCKGESEKFLCQHVVEPEMKEFDPSITCTLSYLAE
jgi:hypothetical protein